jgi:hypothetical protein
MCKEFNIPKREQLKLILEEHERPWDKEPDQSRFTVTVRRKLNETIFKQTFECEIKRHPTMLHLCGYLSFFVSRKVGGFDYNQLLNIIEEAPHGGVTYKSYDSKYRAMVIGFDCAHMTDFSPGLYFLDGGDGVVTRLSGSPRNYKTEAFVRDELYKLAEEVAVQLMVLGWCEADICQEEA